jgi:sigma-B regulation protein RsbU (phosphoserine phosphatase)
MPLLLADIQEIPRCEEFLEPGDRVLFYTDGITERENAAEAMYELSRLCDALSRSNALPSDQLLDAVILDVDNFAAGEEPHDDQTLLLVSA